MHEAPGKIRKTQIPDRADMRQPHAVEFADRGLQQVATLSQRPCPDIQKRDRFRRFLRLSRRKHVEVDPVGVAK